jgi:EpsI family protein
MSAPRLRALVVFCAIVATAALAHFGQPTVYMTDTLGKPNLETLFPKQFGDWQVDASMPMILPSPATQALLNSIYNQTLTRTYVNAAGSRIMLSVAYGGDQSDGTRAHVPEVCYPAQGFQITANSTGQLKLGGRTVPMRQLMAVQGPRNEPITYWLVVGDQVTISRTEQKIAQFRLGLKGLIPDGTLVRVSSIDTDMARGYALQAAFLSDMATAFPDTARDRVFGTQHTQSQ